MVHHPRRRAPVLALVLAVVAVLLGPPASASAANYRYWGYWQLRDGAWAFSQVGPQLSTPADGSVEGWRFAVDDGSGNRTPRAVPTFSQLCGTASAAAGQKRVGVLVDFGRDVDAEGTAAVPGLLATCAVVPSAATGAEVLAAVATVRSENELVCGVQGYPATGCGGEVATLSPAQQAADTPVALPTAGATSAPAAASSGSVSPAVAVAVAVAVLVALLLLAARRRRAAG